MLNSSPPTCPPLPVELPDFGYFDPVIEFFCINVFCAFAPYPIKDLMFCCFLLTYCRYCEELCELPTIMFDVLNLLMVWLRVVTFP